MHSTQLDVFTANTFIRHRVKNTISSDINMTATALGFIGFDLIEGGLEPTGCFRSEGVRCFPSSPWILDPTHTLRILLHPC